MDLTPEQQARVDEIRQALESELRASTSGTTSKAAIKDLEDLKEDALKAIQQTVKFSTNESLKTKVAMWAYEKLIADGKVSTDPLVDLLAGIDKARSADAEQTK